MAPFVERRNGADFVVWWIGRVMPPFWPFKKKQWRLLRSTKHHRSPTVYRRGARTRRSSVQTRDVAAYKDALALFGGGSEEVNAATDQSVLYDKMVKRMPRPKPGSLRRSLDGNPHLGASHRWIPLQTNGGRLLRFYSPTYET